MMMRKGAWPLKVGGAYAGCRCLIYARIVFSRELATSLFVYEISYILETGVSGALGRVGRVSFCFFSRSIRDSAETKFRNLQISIFLDTNFLK